MNISDLPSELFEYYVFIDLHPHCNLINKYIQYSNMAIIYNYTNYCKTQIMVNILCFYNNKPLLTFYQYCCHMELNNILHFCVLNNCIMANYTHIFKWAIANENYYHPSNYPYKYVRFHKHNIRIHVWNICQTAMQHNRLCILKWYYRNYYNNVISYFNHEKDNDPLFYAIIYNNIPIVKWVTRKKFPNIILYYNKNNETYNDNKISKTMCNLLCKYVKN